MGPGQLLGGARRSGRRFLKHDVGVDAADPEGADARAPRCTFGGPLPRLRVHLEHLGQPGTRILEIGLRGKQPPLQDLGGLDERGDAGGAFEVTRVRFE